MHSHSRTRASHHTRLRIPSAFTLIELLITMLVISLIFTLFLLPGVGRTHCGGRQLKDSTQVRGIAQAMVVWASSNRDQYPLPSELDPQNLTVGEPGEAKNTTANIFSVLVMNGNISPEICISPAESNSAQIQLMSDYAYTNPAAAMVPANALWDPAFRGTPEDPIRFCGEQIRFSRDAKPGNQSYAHLLPFGARRSMWTADYNATEPLVGNRGPTYAMSDAAPSSTTWKLLPGPLGTSSNTLLIHGGRTTWEGNIGYNDTHVNFETKPAPQGLTFMAGRAGQNAPAPDNLFVNETDEDQGDGTSGRIDQGRNAYLRPIAEVSEWARPRVWRD